MKVRRATNINPAMLKWARETAGLTLDAAAKSLNLSAKNERAVETLGAFERGAKSPTQRQLFKIENTYKKPLTVFYLDQPPPKTRIGEDFRKFSSKISNRDDAILNTLLRDVAARQQMVRGLLEDDPDFDPPSWPGSVSTSDTIQRATSVVREILGIGTSGAVGKGSNSIRKLFRNLRERVQNAGAFVVLASDLGSYHTSIDEKVFRGFALADEYAPFIVINAQDAVSSRSFTLIHELVHVLVRESGISGQPFPEKQSTPSVDIERFCNDVAGEFLLPEDLISAIGTHLSDQDAQKQIGRLADEACVSESMAAYRLWSTNRITETQYRSIYRDFTKRWQEVKAQRKQDRSNQNSGPSSNTVQLNRLGSTLVELVGTTLRRGELTDTKAAKILGVNPCRVEALLQASHQAG